MVPGPGGSLFVSIPGPGGAVLTRLGRNGIPLSGWPVAVPDSTACGRPLPVGDGSIRVVCDATDVPPPELDPSDMRAFAYDAGGRLMAGWPVLIRPAYTGRRLENELVDYAGGWRVIENVLTFLELTALGDVVEEGQPFAHARVVAVAADGTVRAGEAVPILDDACCRWVIGPDGVAYGVQGPAAPPVVSRITAIDGNGVRAGWPLTIDGIASAPAFSPDGRIMLTIAVVGDGFGSSRVVVIDSDAGGISKSSAELLIETGVLPPTSDGPYECGVPVPRPPLIAPDGTVFIYGDIDDATYAIDASLDVLEGWPIVAGRLERPNPWLGHDGITCPALAIPAAGPGGTVFLPLQAGSSSAGGRLFAVDVDGRTRDGWPVGLSRDGAEFWSVVVGSDGTAYALAIEPEAGGASSATILAIARDSTVIYARTLVDP